MLYGSYCLKIAEYRETVWLIFHPYPQLVSTNSTLKFWPIEKHLRLFTLSIYMRHTEFYTYVVVMVEVVYRNKVAPSYMYTITSIHASSFTSLVHYYYGFIMLVLTHHEFGVLCYHNQTTWDILSWFFFCVFDLHNILVYTITVLLNISVSYAVKVFQLWKFSVYITRLFTPSLRISRLLSVLLAFTFVFTYSCTKVY